jgi:hypothetical protein
MSADGVACVPNRDLFLVFELAWQEQNSLLRDEKVFCVWGIGVGVFLVGTSFLSPIVFWRGEGGLA